jgi:hypothetical protein
MRNALRYSVFALALAGSLGWAGQPEGRSTAFLFSYFTGNGEDGLHLAESADGLAWTPLADGKSFCSRPPAES